MHYQSRIKAWRRGCCKGWLGALLAGVLWFNMPLAKAFDGERAMRDLRAQCDLGPRVPGTPAHEAGRKWIVQQVKALGMTVWEQPFRTRQPLTGREIEACNIWALPAADGPTSPSIMISAHWDTRPYGDRDPAGGKPAMLGANDGASGVAMALELVRGLRESSLRERVVLAFWDAEDAGIYNDNESWCLGSRYAATHRVSWMRWLKLGFNLDMVAGADLQLRPEAFSVQAAPEAVAELWSLGQSVAPNYFVAGPGQPVIDDHLPWINVGVPVVDLVGLPYAYWHTAGDTPEHCSAEVLGGVGNVVFNYLLTDPLKKVGVSDSRKRP